MSSLYLTSVEAAGKTALCLGISKKLMQEGKKVGFLRPVRLSDSPLTDGYQDTVFIKEALGLGEPLDTLSPIVLSRRDLWHSLTEDADDFKQKLEQAYSSVSSKKEIVIMEGLSDLTTDKVSRETCHQIADALNSRVIIILRYSRGLIAPEVINISHLYSLLSESKLNSEALIASEIVNIGQWLGQKLLGIIVNYAPKAKIPEITEKMRTLFEKRGIKLLGVLPEDRTLLGISVAELVKFLDGEIITRVKGENEIIENIMIGALSPDPATDYFGRKANKAVVIRGERADMQLAALQTSTRCLILTNNVRPIPPILNEAEIKQVPIMMVKQDIKSTIANIEEALKQVRFHSLKKLEKFSQILDEYFDFQTLYQGLGLKA